MCGDLGGLFEARAHGGRPGRVAAAVGFGDEADEGGDGAPVVAVAVDGAGVAVEEGVAQGVGVGRWGVGEGFADEGGEVGVRRGAAGVVPVDEVVGAVRAVDDLVQR